MPQPTPKPIRPMPTNDIRRDDDDFDFKMAQLLAHVGSHGPHPSADKLIWPMPFHDIRRDDDDFDFKMARLLAHVGGHGPHPGPHARNDKPIWPLPFSDIRRDDDDFDFKMRRLLEHIERHGPHGLMGSIAEPLTFTWATWNSGTGSPDPRELSRPTGLQDGDLLIVFGGHQGPMNPGDLQADSGFDLRVASYDVPTSDLPNSRYMWTRRVADVATEPSSYTWYYTNPRIETPFTPQLTGSIVCVAFRNAGDPAGFPITTASGEGTDDLWFDPLTPNHFFNRQVGFATGRNEFPPTFPQGGALGVWETILGSVGGGSTADQMSLVVEQQHFSAEPTAPIQIRRGQGAPNLAGIMVLVQGND